jgi:hypothetical protein
MTYERSYFNKGAYLNVRTLSEAMIDLALADSFPAIDPPPWTLGFDVQSGLNAEKMKKEESSGTRSLPASEMTGGRYLSLNNHVIPSINHR